MSSFSELFATSRVVVSYSILCAFVVGKISMKLFENRAYQFNRIFIIRIPDSYGFVRSTRHDKFTVWRKGSRSDFSIMARERSHLLPGFSVPKYCGPIQAR